MAIPEGGQIKAILDVPAIEVTSSPGCLPLWRKLPPVLLGRLPELGESCLTPEVGLAVPVGAGETVSGKLET